VQYTARKLQNEISARSPAAAWNEIHIEALKCSKAHCQAITVSSFFTGIAAAASKYPQLFPQLKNLAELFALYNLEKEMGEFLEDGYLSQTQLEMARERFHELMAAIRPDAVALGSCPQKEMLVENNHTS
jgi:acyl-CoA oxidase